jgi:hypothetical protein
MPDEPLLASMLREHRGAVPSNADQAILAAVDELEARREPLTEHLVDRVEWAMVRALNPGIPWDRMDEFRALARAMKEKG